MLTLRIRQEAEQASGHYRVHVELDEDGLIQTADSDVAFSLGQQDSRDLRWYLEDYLEYPLDPAPRIAGRVEGRMAQLGRDLFAAIFPVGSEARDLWAVVRDHLSEARVEVITDVDHATALPWELLRDPRTDTPVALRARSFVRGYRRGTQRPRLPRAGDGEIRILLVICRPGGREDVPFRSVASQLVRLYPRAPHAFRLKVLRPATFEALGRELRRAGDRGEPYHVVHFDGHGTWADLSGPDGAGAVVPSRLRYAARAGAHGYLLFEDAEAEDNVEFVDGIRLGSLLAEAKVPLLVLNSCRSAHSDVAGDPAEADAEMTAASQADGNPAPVDDAHARVRAYGSLAQEVMDAGVAGVVAMRYNVYVVTATRFVAEMYENLLAGQDLGQAVTRGRKNLADDPVREIALDRMSLQDWPVPVVYEAAPLRLFPPSARTLALGEPDRTATPDKLPAAPDTGFFGRDETLLALDRALDSNPVVLLHAFAGSGKTTTAVEFARWYQLTGGLDEPGLGAGPVVFSSFEMHKPLSGVLNDLWDAVAGYLPPGDADRWLGLSVTARRQVALDLLRRLPVLWIWDNVEPIRGFPAGAESAWHAAEIAELAGFLRDLRSTRAKMVLTSRRTEDELLGDLPTRVALPPMTMPDRIQLARAIAERSGHRLTEVADWRPLLRFTEGNPLTVTVLVKEALRSGVRTRDEVDSFVERLRSGARDLDDDEHLGRSHSLGASLSYGLAEAFADRDRVVLAMLRFFQRVVFARQLKYLMAQLRSAPSDRVRASAAQVTDDDVDRVLATAADIGLLSAALPGVFAVHPALPWYFHRLFTEIIGPLDGADGRAALRCYVDTMLAVASFYTEQRSEGQVGILSEIALDEGNLLNARTIAIQQQWRDAVMQPMRALAFYYEYLGRDHEMARLAEEVVPMLVDPMSGLPPPELEQDFLILTELRVRMARRALDYDLAERLLRTSLQVSERRAEATRATPNPVRNRIRSLGIDYNHLGILLLEQRKPECVEYLEKALVIAKEIDDAPVAAMAAGNLANAYYLISGLVDLDRAEAWLVDAIGFYGDDQIGKSICLVQLAALKRDRITSLLTDGDTNQDVLQPIWHEGIDALNDASRLLPEEAIRERAVMHDIAGDLYQMVDQLDQALHWYQQCIRLNDQLGQVHKAAGGRVKVAQTLTAMGRLDDAALFAERAVQDFSQAGATEAAAKARKLLEEIGAAQHESQGGS